MRTLVRGEQRRVNFARRCIPPAPPAFPVSFARTLLLMRILLCIMTSEGEEEGVTACVVGKQPT